MTDQTPGPHTRRPAPTDRPTAPPALPTGIVEAGHCAVSVGHRRAHKPHTWAWHPGEPDRQLYPRDSRNLPVGAKPYWCDGGVPPRPEDLDAVRDGTR